MLFQLKYQSKSNKRLKELIERSKLSIKKIEIDIKKLIYFDFLDHF